MTTDKHPTQAITIGLIGFGVRMRAIINLILAATQGQVTIGAVYDPDQKAAQKAATSYGPEVVICDSEEAFFQLPSINWVFIGSYNHLHAHHILSTLEAGKHVFCEKPLATHLDDCLEVRDAVRDKGRIFAFGLVLRYSPFYQQIKSIVSRGEIGRIVSFEFNETLDFDHGGRRIFSTWRRDFDLAGSHLLEKCCHDLDIANWIIDSLPVQVASFGGRDFFTPEHAYHVERIGTAPNGRHAYCELESASQVVHPFSPGASIIDNQVAILQYANGVRATFHTNCNTALRERRFYLCGTEGTLTANAYTGLIEWQRIGYDTEVHRIDTMKGGGEGHAGGDQVMAQNLVEAMLNGGSLLASVDEGIRSCAVAFAIDQAMAEKRVVDLTATWARCGIPLEETPLAQKVQDTAVELAELAVL